MYLHISLIQCCRYLCGNRCICKAWYSLLQMFFFWPMYLQLAFLWACRYFSACLSCTIASASCLFWDLKILPSQILHLHPTFLITWRCSPSKITHPQLALSMLCGYFTSKFCIFNPLKSTIADIIARYPLSSIYFTTWANTLLTKKLI